MHRALCSIFSRIIGHGELTVTSGIIEFVFVYIKVRRPTFPSSALFVVIHVIHSCAGEVAVTVSTRSVYVKLITYTVNAEHTVTLALTLTLSLTCT